MNSLLFLSVGLGLVLLVAVRDSSRVKGQLKTRFVKTRYLPHAISMLVLTAQISELVKAIEHVSPVTIIAALFLLGIMVALKSGTESELH